MCTMHIPYSAPLQVRMQNVHNAHSAFHTPTIGKFYVQVKTTRDIKANEELFASYGVEYWRRFQKFYDPNILMGNDYNKIFKQLR